MNPDLQARAEALLALAEKMTPGPWCGHLPGSFMVGYTITSPAPENPNVAIHVLAGDAGGICDLRNDAPGIIRELLAENAALKARIAKLRGQA